MRPAQVRPVSDQRLASRSLPHENAAKEQVARERRAQVRGLVLLAVAAIVFSILRAGVHRVFGPGWWRLW